MDFDDLDGVESADLAVPMSAVDSKDPESHLGDRSSDVLEAEAKENRPVEAAAETRGPSLIFGGGGDFLSKYSDMRSDSEASRARFRKQGAIAGAAKTAAAPQAPQGRPVKAAGETEHPGRMNVQMNQSIVHARTTDKILQVADVRLDHFNAVNLVTALHRLATLVNPAKKASLRRDARFKRITHRLADTLQNADSGALTPQDLSNVAWALTKLGLLNADLFGLISEHILRTVGSFEPVNLSMTLWAFARAGFLDEKLFRPTAAEAKKQLSSFQPQQIANTVWAMAKSGIIDEELFLDAASLALEKIADFQPMNYSMLLYSFAAAKLPHPKLFAEIASRCTVKALSACSSVPHTVTNLAVAFSEAGVGSPEVFEAVGTVACNTLYEFRTQQIATLAKTFARAEERHDRLFTSINSAVASRLGEFKQHDLTELLSAYEALGYSTADMRHAIEAGERSEDPDRLNRWLLFVVMILALLAGWVAMFGRAG